MFDFITNATTGQIIFVAVVITVFSLMALGSALDKRRQQHQTDEQSSDMDDDSTDDPVINRLKAVRHIRRTVHDLSNGNGRAVSMRHLGKELNLPHPGSKATQRSLTHLLNQVGFRVNPKPRPRRRIRFGHYNRPKQRLATITPAS